jgi:hypothetical protein
MSFIHFRCSFLESARVVQFLFGACATPDQVTPLVGEKCRRYRMFHIGFVTKAAFPPLGHLNVRRANSGALDS